MGISNHEAGGKGASSIILKHHHNPESHEKAIQLRAAFGQAVFEIPGGNRPAHDSTGNLKGESGLTNSAVSFLQNLQQNPNP